MAMTILAAAMLAIIGTASAACPVIPGYVFVQGFNPLGTSAYNGGQILDNQPFPPATQATTAQGTTCSTWPAGSTCFAITLQGNAGTANVQGDITFVAYKGLTSPSGNEVTDVKKVISLLDYDVLGGRVGQPPFPSTSSFWSTTNTDATRCWGTYIRLAVPAGSALESCLAAAGNNGLNVNACLQCYASGTCPLQALGNCMRNTGDFTNCNGCLAAKDYQTCMNCVVNNNGVFNLKSGSGTYAGQPDKCLTCITPTNNAGPNTPLSYGTCYNCVTNSRDFYTPYKNVATCPTCTSWNCFNCLVNSNGNDATCATQN